MAQLYFRDLAIEQGKDSKLEHKQKKQTKKQITEVDDHL